MTGNKIWNATSGPLNFTTGDAAGRYVEEQGKLFEDIFTELGMVKLNVYIE